MLQHVEYFWIRIADDFQRFVWSEFVENTYAIPFLLSERH